MKEHRRALSTCGSPRRCSYPADNSSIKDHRGTTFAFATWRQGKVKTRTGTQEYLFKSWPAGFVQAPPFLDRDDNGCIEASPSDELGTFREGVVNQFTEACLSVLQLPFGHLNHPLGPYYRLVRWLVNKPLDGCGRRKFHTGGRRCHLRAIRIVLFILRSIFMPCVALYVVETTLPSGFESHSLRHVFNYLQTAKSLPSVKSARPHGSSETRSPMSSHDQQECVNGAAMVGCFWAAFTSLSISFSVRCPGCGPVPNCSQRRFGPRCP